MEYSEISIDYFNRGNMLDRLKYYHFYISIALKYFSEFIDIYSEENVKEYILNNVKVKVDSKQVDMYVKDVLEFRQIRKLEDIQTEFYEYLGKVEDAKNTDSLASEMLNLYMYVSRISCFKIIPKDTLMMEECNSFNTNLGIIANRSGWFAFNSYMFALVNGVSLIGVPSYISEFDGFTGCPSEFLLHDCAHTKNMLDVIKDGTSLENMHKLYESILKGNYTRQQKDSKKRT